MGQTCRHIKLLYLKEMLGVWRSFKWLWVPLVMLILGISQPIVIKVMPQILSSAGGVSPELIQQLSTPQPGEVLIQVLSQYNIIGMIILVLPIMGIISGEIQGGIALNFLVKPIKSYSFVLAKWLSALTLTIPSFVVGYGGAWYYTNVLIGTVQARAAMLGGLYFMMWVIFVVTLAVAVSGMMNQIAGGAAIMIGAVMFISIIGGMVPEQWGWFPGQIANLASIELAGQSGTSSALWPMLSTTLLVIVLLVAVIERNRRRSSWVQTSSTI